MTRRIHALEDEAGKPLFTRTASGMEITPAGTALLRHARNIQAEMAQARLNVRHAELKERAPFCMGVYGVAIFIEAPRILKEFSRRNPHAELRLYHIGKEQQIAALREGKIQAALDRFLPREPDLAYEVVRQQDEQLCAVLHKDHPLAARKYIDVADLAGAPGVGAASEIELETNLQQVFGSVTQTAHRANDILSVLTLVSSGLCVALLPSSTRSIPMPNVVYRPCSGAPTLPFSLICAYRPDDRSHLLAELLETIRALREADEDGEQTSASGVACPMKIDP